MEKELFDNKALKIIVVTTPIRPIPTEYPPLGSMAVIKALRKAGFDNTQFYDIDGLRPKYEEALKYLVAAKPDVLGISAVVSTAYEYVKKLSLDIKRLLPDTTIVLGGNLGASAEILLHKTGVDFVAVGEGERTMTSFVQQFIQSRNKADFRKVGGLVYLDGSQLVNTGFQLPVAKTDIYDVDWQDLEKNSRIKIFFPQATRSLLAESTFAQDPRIFEEHRQGKTIGTLVASKGCVARCTFCHRWDKGIRYVPVPILMERLEYIINRYNVGFVTFGDENFGTDKRWLKEFCQEIKKFDVLWRVSGMRVNCVSPEYLQMMKEVGCSAVYFGMETGSERMLQIMEKKVKLKDNYNAMQWIIDNDLHTTIQLVLGMPGENPQTIRETAAFAAFGACLKEDKNPLDLSINYAQALPGTPLYEFARHKGLIGSGIDEEERYLLAISDRDAGDETTALPLTGYPKLITETWRPYIIAKAGVAYIKKYGKAAYNKQLIKSQYFSVVHSDEEDSQRAEVIVDNVNDTGYFNYPKEKRALDSTRNNPFANAEDVQVDVSGYTETVRDTWQRMNVTDNQLPDFWSLLFKLQFRILIVRYPTIVYRLRFFLPLFVLLFDWQRNGFKYACRLIVEYLKYRLTSIFRYKWFEFDYKSLRKIVGNDISPNKQDSEAMMPLRKGR